MFSGWSTNTQLNKTTQCTLGTLESIPQPSYQGPSCIKVHNNLSTDLLVDELQVESVGVASVQLASLLPDLERLESYPYFH